MSGANNCDQKIFTKARNNSWRKLNQLLAIHIILSHTNKTFLHDFKKCSTNTDAEDRFWCENVISGCKLCVISKTLVMCSLNSKVNHTVWEDQRLTFSYFCCYYNEEAALTNSDDKTYQHYWTVYHLPPSPPCSSNMRGAEMQINWELRGEKRL